jgi:hypothetical protein
MGSYGRRAAIGGCGRAVVGGGQRAVMGGGQRAAGGCGRAVIEIEIHRCAFINGPSNNIFNEMSQIVGFATERALPRLSCRGLHDEPEEKFWVVAASSIDTDLIVATGRRRSYDRPSGWTTLILHFHGWKSRKGMESRSRQLNPYRRPWNHSALDCLGT